MGGTVEALMDDVAHAYVPRVCHAKPCPRDVRTSDSPSARFALFDDSGVAADVTAACFNRDAHAYLLDSVRGPQ